MTSILERLLSDVRHAWRMIFKMPLTAAVVITSLGVGIGVNTAIFTWIQAVVFQPLPGVSGGSSFQHVEIRAETGSYPGMSWLEYQDVRARVTSFRDLLAFRMVPLYIGETGRSERVFGSLVSGNYFSALGLTPALGRFIQPEELTRAGGETVAVISYEFWQTRFNGAANALGQTLRVNALPLTIIGVTPPRFQGTVLGLNFSLWTPATLAPVLLSGSAELVDRNTRGYGVLGKLKEHVSRAQAEAELDRVLLELARIYPETNAKMQGEVIPFWSAPRGPQRLLANSLVILQGIMLLLLLAVCGNTANLMLARASTRYREVGVRLAIGAGPWRVVSLLLIENLVLAFFGACLGVVLAVWGTEALRAVPMIGAFPIKFQTGVDWASLAFAILLGLLCGLIFGLAPAIQLARIDPYSAFRSGTGKLSPSRLRNALMGVEVALALIVLIVAGVFFKSFRETRAADPGFRRDGILLAAYDLTGRKGDASSARVFAAKLLERLRALPPVEGAAIAAFVPLDIHGMPLRSFTVEGHIPTGAAQDRSLSNTVTRGYFFTLGIPLRTGEDFADLNDLTHVPQVVVNEEFVHRFLAPLEPIGRRLTSRGRGYVISGVAANSIYESFNERPSPMIYFSYRDNPAPLGEIHVRTRIGAELPLASSLRRAVRELDPMGNIYDVRTMNDHVDKNALLRRIPARMFVVLGPLLLVLAAVGIYAVVAYSVAQRTTEIGVRLALGASPGRVVRQIVRETLHVVYKGAAAGWLIAFVVDIHLAHGVIYLPVFVGIPAALLLVATYACWLPAHRASRVDPMVVLRHE